MMKLNYIRRASYAVAGILLFILSIELLKGTTGLMLPVLKNFLGFANNPSGGLGLGWILSYLIMSGSPVAALSLSFLDSGLLSAQPSFAMIIGSRLGASFILLIIGLVEYLRGKSDLADSTSIGFLSFIITYSICVPTLFLGLYLTGLGTINLGFKLSFISTISRIYTPLVDLTMNFIGAAPSFIISLFTLYLSLSIFERAFRKIKVRRTKSSWMNFLMERPSFSFIFGAAVTLLGQSVSLSVGIMVPLYLNGYVQRKNLIPYIMGANVTTFTDTLAAALLLENAMAVNIVSIALLGNLLVSGVVLLFYRKYFILVRNLMNRLLLDKRILLGFLLFLLIFPVLLIVL